MLDRLAPPSPAYWKEVGSVVGFDPGGSSPPGESPARAFLRGLLAAYRAREREPGRVGSRGEAELAARRRIKALSPALFARYMADVGHLFERR